MDSYQFDRLAWMIQDFIGSMTQAQMDYIKSIIAAEEWQRQEEENIDELIAHESSETYRDW
ncbi:MAG TPA: hypothetical protein P5244_01285 [Syntrophales bacterium]|nr:hypothetical protein [Syntrophales bacterium]